MTVNGSPYSLCVQLPPNVVRVPLVRAGERARVMDAEVVAHLVAHDAERHRAVDPARRAREGRRGRPSHSSSPAGTRRRRTGRRTGSRPRPWPSSEPGWPRSCTRSPRSTRRSCTSRARLRSARAARTTRPGGTRRPSSRCRRRRPAPRPVSTAARVSLEKLKRRTATDFVPGDGRGGGIRRRLHAPRRGEDAVAALSVRANLASRERLHSLTRRLERDEPRNRRVDSGPDADRRRERVAVPRAERSVERLLRLPGGEPERHAHERKRQQGEHDEATADAHGSQPRRLAAQVNDPPGSSLGRGSCRDSWDRRCYSSPG